MKTKVYVVTGATSGIGKALVEILSKTSIVFAGYRSESKKEDLQRISEKIIPFYVDYAKPETVAQAVSFIKSKCERIDTLIKDTACATVSGLA